MYRTSTGERTFKGAERTLFVESLAMITDLLSPDEGDFVVGVPIFDDLQRNQKLSILVAVGKALLLDNVASPKLVAVGEAAVAAVYRHVYERIVDEIREPGPPVKAECPWRTLVLAAYNENEELEEIVSEDCDDVAEWQWLVDCLLDRIIWDHDWEMVAPLDADPEDAESVKQLLGIDDEYYSWIPADPSDQEADRILNDLMHLTGEARSRA